MEIRISLDLPPTRLTRDNQPPVGLPSCVPSWLVTDAERGRNINRLSIGYAFRPHLRSRLTLAGRAFSKKPWPYGGQDSHLSFRSSCRQTHFRFVRQSLRSAFSYRGTLPYHPARDDTRTRSAASVDGLRPAESSAQHHTNSELSRNLGTKAAQNPPSCSCKRCHCVSHLATFPALR